MNHQGSAMIARVAQYVTAVLGLIFFVLIYADNMIGVDGGLYVAYVAMGLSTVVVLAFAIKGLTRKSLIGIGAFAALLAITYAMADDSVKPGQDITPGTAKLIGAGITMFVIALATAAALIIFGEVRRLIK
jgi:inner membrane protein involved in colicin E2 resistance